MGRLATAVHPTIVRYPRAARVAPALVARAPDGGAPGRASRRRPSRREAPLAAAIFVERVEHGARDRRAGRRGLDGRPARWATSTTSCRASPRCCWTSSAPTGLDAQHALFGEKERAPRAGARARLLHAPARPCDPVGRRGLRRDLRARARGGPGRGRRVMDDPDGEQTLPMPAPSTSRSSSRCATPRACSRSAWRPWPRPGRPRSSSSTACPPTARSTSPAVTARRSSPTRARASPTRACWARSAPGRRACCCSTPTSSCPRARWPRCWPSSRRAATPPCRPARTASAAPATGARRSRTTTARAAARTGSGSSRTIFDRDVLLEHGFDALVPVGRGHRATLAAAAARLAHRRLASARSSPPLRRRLRLRRRPVAHRRQGPRPHGRQAPPARPAAARACRWPAPSAGSLLALVRRQPRWVPYFLCYGVGNYVGMLQARGA